MGGGLGKLGKKDEGITYKLAVTKQPWGCKYSVGNMVSNITITVYGASKYWTYGMITS